MGLDLTLKKSLEVEGKKLCQEQGLYPWHEMAEPALLLVPVLLLLLQETMQNGICAKCSAPWQDDGDDRWIVCDRCDKQYHLQCCGIQYRRLDYYTLDIEHMPFTCDAC